MKEIDIQKAFEIKNPIFIDVRSPGEYKESHIPGSINIPLFSDDERAQVGTTYKVKGSDPAQWLGMELVSPKIPNLMTCIRKEIEQGKEPIIYCWRGGMRSKSITTFAEMAGLKVQRLTGGFRHYRQWVLDHLNESLLPEQFVVLHGMTGVGKTTLLHKLKNMGFPILDLETCAGHRGSVFGGIGSPVHNQKTFEALLVHALEKIQGLPYVFMEAESKRIGKAVQPDFLLEAKKKGVHIILSTSVEIRVERIFEDYVQPHLKQEGYKDLVMDAIRPILKRFTPITKEKVLETIEHEEYKQLISILLTDYYDPRYQHKLEDYEGTFQTINVDNINNAVMDIEKYVFENLSNLNIPTQL